MSAAGIAAEWITEEQALAALLPEWDALWRAHPRGTPFQVPAWQYHYWRCFRSGRLAVLTLRIGSMLAGVIPFCAGTDAMWLLAASVTDIQDALFDDRLREAVATVLQRSLPRGVSLILEDLPDDSALLALPAPPGWHDRKEPYASWPTLSFPVGAKELSDILPASALRNLRHAEHRAARCGGVSLEAAQDDTLDAALELLFALHRKRWEGRNLPGALSTEEVRAFHRGAARGLLKAGILRLWLLRVGGKVAAAYYGFNHRGTACYYLSGFDPEQSYANPGTLVVGHAIAAALAEGMRAFNFLRGREAYKYRWGAVDTVAWRRILTAV
jgi:CelD/BcsL family acetyltransferase involved in cellulose biosynthesis